MGRQKELLAFYQDISEWAEDNYDEDIGMPGSELWEEAVNAFERHQDEKIDEEIEWYYLNQRTPKTIFDTQISSVTELLEYNALSSETHFSLLVMLHGHTVAAVEAYLASIFIHKVINSEEKIKKLVETDPVFSKTKFTLKEIFEKQKGLQNTVARYLKDLIFHKLEKVTPMFKEVLDCEFGDIQWLYSAVEKRHHCVHRAGLNKDGDRIDISADSIKELINNCVQLIQEIENKLEETLEAPNLESSVFDDLILGEIK